MPNSLQFFIINVKYIQVLHITIGFLRCGTWGYAGLGVVEDD